MDPIHLFLNGKQGVGVTERLIQAGHAIAGKS
jgi:hypothetical protein